jgi:hypothetical protein
MTIERAGEGLNVRFENTPSMTGSSSMCVMTRSARAGRTEYRGCARDVRAESDGLIERMKMRAISPLTDFSYDYRDLLFLPEQ